MAVQDNIIKVEPLVLPVSNMFASGRVIVFADGTSRLIRDRIKYTPREDDDYYTIKYDDRLTKIAYDYFKNKVQLPSHYFWIIADCNQQEPIRIKNPLDLSGLVGKQIVIPNILNFKLTN